MTKSLISVNTMIATLPIAITETLTEDLLVVSQKSGVSLMIEGHGEVKEVAIV